MSTLEYTKGLATSEQNLVVAAKNFAVNQCGWELYYAAAETASDTWYILRTLGTNPGRWRPFYGEVRGISDYINVNAGVGFDTVAVDWVDSSSLWSDDVTRAPAAGDLYYHFFGNADGIWLVWYHKNNDDWYEQYIGYFDSFYSDEDEDYYPACVVGHRYEYRWFDEARIRAYGPWLLGSGIPWTYYVHKDIYTYGYNQAAPGTVDGSIMMSRLSFRDGSEVRGVLKHVKGISGHAMVQSGGWITVSGANHKYFTCGYWTAQDEWMAIGPVDTASGTDWKL